MSQEQIIIAGALTESRHPESGIESQWGLVPYKRWCQLEADRLMFDTTRKITLITEESGDVFLAETK